MDKYAYPIFFSAKYRHILLLSLLVRLFMESSSIVVLDIGGTKIHTGRFRKGKIEHSTKKPFHSDIKTSVSGSLAFIEACIEELKTIDTIAVAIGVPSIIDIDKGIVLDTINIPAWQKLPLKELLQTRINLPVYINNDVNCFTVGEHISGKGQGHQDIIGLCLGTGLGAGIILQNNLYMGANCSAGEIGEFPYLNATIDNYCSGQFFKDNYRESGEKVAEKARLGDREALTAYNYFGQHLAKAISHLLLILDPKIIIIGGSVANSFDLFIDSVWQNLTEYPYQSVIQKLSIQKSCNANSALLGAAYLYLDSVR